MDAAETKARLIAASRAVVDAKDALTAADRETGDGDHGVGMARGFSAAIDALEKAEADTIGPLFKAMGIAILSKAGGASGAVFGSFFTAAAAPLSAGTLSPEAFCDALEAGLEAVMARGGASPGDKTVIDALKPAIAFGREKSADGIEATLAAAAAGAAEGLEATRDMIARTGKARSLGERCLGHIDPGALTMTTFLQEFSAGVSSH